MKLRLIALPAALIAGFAVSGCDEVIGGGGPAPDLATAINNCIAAVKNETKNDNVSLYASTPSSTGTNVLVTVGGATAPWACDTDLPGNVQKVYFTTEG